MEVSGPLRSDSGEALRHAALDGLCLALLSAWTDGHDVGAERLIASLREHPGLCCRPASADLR